MSDQALEWWEKLSDKEKQKFSKKCRVETINTKTITSIYFLRCGVGWLIVKCVLTVHGFVSVWHNL